MNEKRIKNAGIDGLLSNYFQAQMSNPWPACQATAAVAELPRRSTRWLTFSRFAVAASVGLLLVGYLALAGFFPREPAGKINQDPLRNIGSKQVPGVPQPGANR